MSGVGLRNRLSPPLMFAFRFTHRQKDARRGVELREIDGESQATARRGRVQIAITEKMLREEVKSDLEHLMNTIALEASEDLASYPEVRKSILNYGIPDMARRTLDEAAIANITREIEDALRRYEPRLVKNSIKVARDESADALALKLRFVVHADLFCEPIHVPVEFVADVESGTGKIAISRL
jgi:type VI secretion system protein ImpF